MAHVLGLGFGTGHVGQACPAIVLPTAGGSNAAKIAARDDRGGIVFQRLISAILLGLKPTFGSQVLETERFVRLNALEQLLLSLPRPHEPCVLIGDQRHERLPVLFMRLCRLIIQLLIHIGTCLILISF